MKINMKILFFVKLKLLGWIVSQLFVANHEAMLHNPKKVLTKVSKESELNLFFHLSGGVGDVSMAAAYLQKLHKFIGIKNYFVISTDQPVDVVRSIFLGHDYIKDIYRLKDINIDEISQSYDARLDISRFPRVVFFDEQKLAKLSPQTCDLFSRYRVFNDRYFNFSGSEIEPLRVIYSLNNGHTRRTQSDLFHALGMDQNTFPFMDIDTKSLDILDKYHLDGNYITLQCGVDANFIGKNIRIWPIPYYNSLIEKIKSNFPSLTIVQVGKMDESSNLTGIDIDLRGTTSFDQLKAVLKFSKLHIDGECGMVHLKHALRGKSAVFFGQTSVDFCGYPENINLLAKNSCNHWCEWVTPDWMKKCCRGFDNPPCMKELTSEFCFQKILSSLKIIAQGDSYTFHSTDSINNFNPYLFFGDSPFLNNHSITIVENKIPPFVTPHNKHCYGSILNIPYADNTVPSIYWDDTDLNEFSKKFARSEILRVLLPDGILYIKSENKFLKKTLSN